MSTLAERFWAKLDVQGPDDCWPWKASTNKHGYGRLNLGARGEGVELAHRIAWQLANGPVPEGNLVCHRCDNPPCCNPAHLWLGTQTDNMADAARKGRLPGGTAVGSRHGISKLTEASVREIRKLAGRCAQRELARQFGVSVTTIQSVVARRTWRHI